MEWKMRAPRSSPIALPYDLGFARKRDRNLDCRRINLKHRHSRDSVTALAGRDNHRA